MTADFSVAAVEKRISKTKGDKPGELGIEECRDIYLQEIFDWTDYWSENWGGNFTDSEAKEFVVTNLIELWKSYAYFEAKNKQFKKAVEVFKKAVNDSVVSMFARLFEVFAEYYLEKKKPASAQKVLIDGLCKPMLATEETHKLWNYLLEFTKRITKVEDLSFEKLYQEIATAGIEMHQTLPFPQGCDEASLASIKVNRLVPKSAPVLDVAESKVSEPFGDSENTFTNKVDRLSLITPTELKKDSMPTVKPDSSSAPTASAISTLSQTNIPISIRWFEDNTFSKTQSVSAIATSLSTVWTAEQILLTFQHRPPTIFCAPTQDPIVEGAKNLSAEDSHELEIFLTTSITDAEQNGHAKNMLNLLEAMWYQQALRERHFDAWITLLNQAHRREEFAVTSTQYASSDLARVAERALYQRQEQARLLLVAYIHKCLYELLVEQVGILTTLKFPRCTPMLLQQLEQWSNSSRKSAIAHLQKMHASRSAANPPAIKFKAEEFGVLCTELQRLRQLIGAVFSRTRVQYLLTQGRVSFATLLMATQQQPQQLPAYSQQATTSAVAAYEARLQQQLQQNMNNNNSSSSNANPAMAIPSAMSGIKREISGASSTDGDDLTSPGGLRRKTKRRRTVSLANGSGLDAVAAGGAALGSYDGAQINSYNMPQMTLSDVAREQIYLQQQHGQLR